MRRSPAPVAAAVLLLWCVGSTLGAAPTAPPTPSPAATPDPSTPSGATPEPAEPAVGPSPGASADRDADPAGRWIVVLRPGTDAVAASARQGRREGFKPDRLYRYALRGYAAPLNHTQVAALRADPSVAEVVPDEQIQVESQTMPTGITRVGANRSSVATIDGVDQRVDADVAIVDTGIARVADLNVAGGDNCSTSDPTAWRDVYGHGTHVAGTVGAIDNGSGVVGVAPGVRLWAVKILNDSGNGLLSWYVCGLDWIAAQRDPTDASRPLFEAVNMSVAKWGSDDGNCGATNHDVLHAAICRLVASGVTVVAAAGNDSGSAAARVPAAYNEVITVSALADTDGKPGGLGGHRCYSWGTYDVDDTFADFSNYGSDVDLIAPGKCIWSTVPNGYAYMSGTSMATPHVTGAVALLKASRSGLTPAEVKAALQYLGSTNWRTSTDPDPTHERLLDVSRIGPRGDFAVSAGPDAGIAEAGGTARVPVSIVRTPTSFERIGLSAESLPGGFAASFAPSSVYGFAGLTSTLSVVTPRGTPDGSYPITIVASEHGIIHRATATILVHSDNPTAHPPATAAQVKGILGSATVPTRVVWPAATDPSTTIAGYELQASVDGAAWSTTTTTAGSVRSVAASQTLGHPYQYRVRASDQVGNWSPWAVGPTVTAGLVQDRSTAVTYRGTWTKSVYARASGGSTTYARSGGARARTTFRGRGVAIVAPVGTTRGSARIYIDGIFRSTLSFRSSTNRSRVLMFSTTFPTVATHAIDILLVGNGRVDLDAFVILR